MNNGNHPEYRFDPETGAPLGDPAQQTPTPTPEPQPSQDQTQAGYQQSYQNQNGGYQNPNGAYRNENGGAYQNPYNPPYTPPYVDESGLFNENKLSRKNGQSATVKIGDWMKADCFGFLNLIPIFGSIAYIVILFYLAFSSKTAKSMKNRYIASLIWAAIALVVSIVLAIALGAALVSLFSQMGDPSGWFDKLNNL